MIKRVGLVPLQAASCSQVTISERTTLLQWVLIKLKARTSTFILQVQKFICKVCTSTTAVCKSFQLLFLAKINRSKGISMIKQPKYKIKKTKQPQPHPQNQTLYCQYFYYGSDRMKSPQCLFSSSGMLTYLSTNTRSIIFRNINFFLAHYKSCSALLIIS